MTVPLSRSWTLLLAGLVWVMPCCSLADEPSLGRRVVQLFRRGEVRHRGPEQDRLAETVHIPSPRRDTRSRGEPTDVLLVVAPSLLNADEGRPDFELHSQTDAEIARFEQLAIANNPVLAQAQSRINAAIGRQIQAGLFPNPTVGYDAAQIGDEGTAGMQGLMFAQEFPRGYKRELSATVASHEREQAEAQREAQAWRLRNSVRQFYFETLAAQQASRLAQELTVIAEKGVEVAVARETQGEGTLAETLQAQIELEQVHILAARSANNHRAAWKRLVAVVGQPDLAVETLNGELLTVGSPRDESQAATNATISHPELEAAEAGVRRAEAALHRARVETIPNVMIEAGTQFDFASDTQIVNAGVSLPIPIWNRNQGNIMAAEAELIRARRDVDRVRLSLADRFAAAWARYRNALAQVERYGQRLSDDEAKRILNLRGAERQQALQAHPEILPRAQLALVLATEGWQRGEFNYMQVLTAQRTLTQATLASVRSLADLRQALTALDGYLLTDGIGENMAGAGTDMSDSTQSMR
jgi:cobalt-zinc-cadmium efflux system outer membrane protein